MAHIGNIAASAITARVRIQNIDAPTFAELTGSVHPENVQGRSLLEPSDVERELNAEFHRLPNIKRVISK